MDEFPLRSHSRTDRGLVHERNEDDYAVFDPSDGGRVLLVCDGMGGMGRGDEASQLAVETIREALETATVDSDGKPNERLAAALRLADERLRTDLVVTGESAQPGSTAVMVWVHDNVAHVCWVGDSRAYLVRDGAVVARTRDHKLVEDLVDAGQMTAADARNSSLAHVVTRALGGKGPLEPGVTPQALPTAWKLRTGDRILVCSDGLTDLVQDEEIPELLEGDLDGVSERLVSIANARGGHDNITCVVATWDGPDWVDDGSEPEETVELEPDAPTREVPVDDAEETVETTGHTFAPLDPPVDVPKVPVDVSAIARELTPWWIATAALLLCAIAAIVFAAVDG